MFFSTDGEATLEAKENIISINIQNSLATITQTQQLENSSRVDKEFEYSLQLDGNSVLLSLQIFYSDNSQIDCQVLPKESAQESYQDLISSGEIPVLAFQLENALNLHIGSLAANDHIKVKLVYSCPMGASEDYWKLSLKNIFADDLNISQKLTLRVESDSVIEDWKSNLDLRFELNGKVLTGFFDKVDNETYDLVEFFYKCQEITKPKGILQKSGEEYAAMLSFIPYYECSEDSERYEGIGEFIFLLDRSGSMHGDRIKFATKAALMFVKSLNAKSRFNIVSFGSTYELMFSESQLAQSENVDEAVNRLKGFEADMGGTDILTPLESIFNTPLIPNFNRYVFLLTDGDVESLDAVLSLITAFNKTCKVYTLGIAEANEDLIVKGAKNGNGESYLINSIKDISKSVVSALEKCSLPYITDLKLNWDCEVAPSLSSLKNFQFGRSFCVYALLDKYPDTNPILSCKESINEKSLNFVIENLKFVEGDEIFKLWAKHKINEESGNLLEISVKYQVISPVTAYFGCKKDMNGSTVDAKRSFGESNKGQREVHQYSKFNRNKAASNQVERIKKKYLNKINQIKTQIDEMHSESNLISSMNENILNEYRQLVEKLKKNLEMNTDEGFGYFNYYMLEYEYREVLHHVLKSNHYKKLTKDSIEEELDKVDMELNNILKYRKTDKEFLAQDLEFLASNSKNVSSEIKRMKSQKCKELLIEFLELKIDFINSIQELLKLTSNHRSCMFKIRELVKNDEFEYLYMRKEYFKNDQEIDLKSDIEEVERFLKDFERRRDEKAESFLEYVENNHESILQTLYDAKDECYSKLENNFENSLIQLKENFYKLEKIERDINDKKGELDKLEKKFEQKMKDNEKAGDEQQRIEQDKRLQASNYKPISLMQTKDEDKHEDEAENEEFLAVVLSQKSEGFWVWNEIISVVRVSEKVLLLGDVFNNTDVAATALALALLYKVYEMLRDEWVLIEKKAVRWIKQNSGDYQSLVKRFEEVLD